MVVKPKHSTYVFYLYTVSDSNRTVNNVNSGGIKLVLNYTLKYFN